MGKLEGKAVSQHPNDNKEKCPLCGGSLEARHIFHPQFFDGNLVILENVPAEVCLQCGEILVSPSVVERMQEKVWAGKPPKRTAHVPVYDLLGTQ